MSLCLRKSGYSVLLGIQGYLEDVRVLRPTAERGRSESSVVFCFGEKGRRKLEKLLLLMFLPMLGYRVLGYSVLNPMVERRKISLFFRVSF